MPNSALRRPRANTAFQPTRCAALALQDRWHFGTSTDLSMSYLRSERLNAGRWAAAFPHDRCIHVLSCWRLGDISPSTLCREITPEPRKDMRTFHYEPCDPPVVPLTFGDDEPPKITARIQALFVADQAARQSPPSDWGEVSRADAERRHEVLNYLSAGQVNAAETLYYAAFIFQHGNCPEHYDLAHQLAEQAIQRGYSQARWIYAASLDRALMSRGLPQKYGTQYVSYDGGPLELYQYDPTTTDEERQQYNVPPLSELLHHTKPEE
jgi:hypothetical protein